jgi:dienelactone hydrolase
MRRRTLLLGLAAGMAATVTGCSSGSAEVPSPASNRTPAAAPSANGPFASVNRSPLLPRTVTPYAPAAGTAPAGAFAVGRRGWAVTRGPDRPLTVQTWYPAAGGAGAAPIADATPAPGRFPVVLFSHGLTAAPDDYADMLARWAQAGFVVVAPRYPHTWRDATDYDPGDVVNQPADASYVLTQVLALDRSSDPFAGRLDPDRVAAAGHSGGGITTAGLFSSSRDDRLKAGIIQAGTDLAGASFQGATAALLFVHGRRDDTVRYDAGHTVFEATPWSRAMLTITDGGHTTTGADFAAVTGTSTDFLRWSLYGDAAAKTRIPVSAAVGGVATLEDQL